MKVVTRFAPSPTGFLHIGGVRTALFAYLYARKQGGEFILRIEDTDKAREVAGSIEHIKESLSWIGIEWDYGPDKPGTFGSCLQSERLPIYRKYAEQLIAEGFAYPDPYTAKELETFRQNAETKKEPFLFRNHRPETFISWDGSTSLRFKVPEIKRYHWHDVARGDLEAGPEMLDDFILIKSDGYPTYNFAHIVDDLEMGVTHVMRGQEFIASTPKFLSLYDALKIPYPVFVTMPPIMGPDGKKKLGKRDGAKDILDYRIDGYLPEAMANFLALIGWNPGTEQELFTMEELIKVFSLEKIQRSGGAFNLDKLNWMNKEYLAKLSDEDFLNYIKDAFPISLKEENADTDKRIEKLAPSLRERIHTKSELKTAIETGEYDWVFKTPTYDTELLKWKQDNSQNDALPRLKKVAELLTTTDFSSPETIKAVLFPYAEEAGRGQVLWPLRVALTGQEKSPDPFTCSHILGSEETIARVKAACDKISQ